MDRLREKFFPDGRDKALSPEISDRDAVAELGSQLNKDKVVPGPGSFPVWSKPRKSPTSAYRIHQNGMAVPCSIVEPLCAGIGLVAKRLLQLRSHLYRIGKALTEERRASGGIPSIPSPGESSGDVWFDAHVAWSPSTMRLWTRPSGAKVAANQTDPSGMQTRRDYIKDIINVRPAAPLGTAVQRGDDWEALRLSASDPYSEATKVTLDHEPWITFFPQAGVHQAGRVWSAEGQVIPLACRSLAMDSGMYPAHPKTASNLAAAIAGAKKGGKSDMPVVVSTASIWSEGPAHLIAETLPRILSVRQLLLTTPGAMLQLIGTNALAQNMMSAIGVRGKVSVKAGRLAAPMVVLPEATPCGNPSTAQLLLLRRFVASGLGTCPAPEAAADRLIPPELAEPVLPPNDSRPIGSSGGSSEYVRRVDEHPCSAGAELTAGLVAQLGLRMAIHAVGVDSAAGQAMACAGADDAEVGKPLYRVVPPQSVSSAGIHVLVIERKGSRELKNHNQVVSALREIDGVAKVSVFAAKASNPNTWNFWKQWSGADMVVGPHGAGLVNSIALPAWAHVVEVLAKKGANMMYAGVTNRLGLRYHMLVGHDMAHGTKGTADMGEMVGAVTEAAADIRALRAELGSFEVRELCKASRLA